MTIEIANDLGVAATDQGTPEQVLKSIVDGINTGNLDGLMALCTSLMPRLPLSPAASLTARRASVNPWRHSSA